MKIHMLKRSRSSESVPEADLVSNLNVHASVFQSGNKTTGDSGMPCGFKMENPKWPGLAAT